MSKKGHKYLVFGMGVGKAIGSWLAEQSDAELVMIADKDKSVLKVGRMMSKSAAAKCEYMVADIQSLDLVELFQKFDVVVSALPAARNVYLAKMAIESETPFCDLGGVNDVTNRMMEFNFRYESIKVPIVPDCGLMPGSGILMADYLSRGLKNPEIKIYVGGLPQKPKLPANYFTVFNLGGLEEICHNQAPILRDSKIIWMKPFSDYETFKISELSGFYPDGELEAFISAGASIAPWTFKKKYGAKSVEEKTVRWPGFVKFVKDIPRESFQATVGPYFNVPINSKNPDLVWMRVQVAGLGNGRRIKRAMTFLDRLDPVTGFTAMERTTGFSAAITAEMLANGMAKPGVNTPELAFDDKAIDFFIDKLKSEFKIREEWAAAA